MSMEPLSSGYTAQLLRLARDSIESRVCRHAKPPTFDGAEGPLTRPCGAFVSLHRHGALRGCIGFVEAVEPLWKTVCDVAASAAAQDPRFEPVAETELPEIEIEISVLTPLQEVRDVATIRIGTHGLLIRQGSRSGLLLPQVAVEYEWDAEQFLGQTCLKAGLETGCWQKSDTRIFTFAAQIFHE